MFYFLLTVVFFLLEFSYFRIAAHFNIVDKPNDRSSHKRVTIRGGGIIFLFAAVMAVILYPQYWLPLSGILIIGIISFIDDRLTISRRLRLLIHLLAVTLLFVYLQVINTYPIFILPILYIMVIGVINIYNFMDGINGITGTYSLVILAGIQYVNLYQVSFIERDLIWMPMLACAVFLFFNFRTKAKCFAGDVGSIAVAFWIVFLLLKLIIITHHWRYVLFLAVYGVDSVLTIVHRLFLKQNIFEAHRMHFYQLLANEMKIPHLYISVCYALLQLLIIGFVLVNRSFSSAYVFAFTVAPLIIIYIFIKPFLMKLKQVEKN